MSTVKDLKEALIDKLAEAVENGVDVLDKDGVVHRITAPAPILAVAAKVVKDFADEAKEGDRITGQLDKLSNYLNQRRPDIAAKTN